MYCFLVVQKYLQSTTVRIEEMRVKRRDAQLWMTHRMLPDTLRERIRRYEQYKWQETRGVEERTLIRTLPKDLRRDINRHLCFDLIMRVSSLSLVFMIYPLKLVQQLAKIFVASLGANVWENGRANTGCNM